MKGQGRWREAAASLREAVRLRPDFAAAFTNLGIVLAEQSEHDQALACYARAGDSPSPRGGVCGRGCSVGRRGELEEAEALFREAIGLIPDSAELWGNHGYFLAELDGSPRDSKATARRSGSGPAPGQSGATTCSS